MIKRFVRDDSSNAVTFDLEKDIVDQFFNCVDINPYPEKLSPRKDYKGYTILLLRMLVINLETLLKNWSEYSITPTL